jgi:hypothetical protein
MPAKSWLSRKSRTCLYEVSADHDAADAGGFDITSAADIEFNHGYVFNSIIR